MRRGAGASVNGQHAIGPKVSITRRAGRIRLAADRGDRQKRGPAVRDAKGIGEAKSCRACEPAPERRGSRHPL